MENIELTIALVAVVIECFAFALALALANEFFATIYAGAPRPRLFTRSSARAQDCARCGTRFATDTDVAYCDFCAVVVMYEHHAYITNLLAPEPRGVRAPLMFARDQVP
jgi:hypothetical protein